MQQVDILVGGKPVRQIAHNGRIFIVAHRGSEYSIRLKNNSVEKVLGVCSVDGLNVIDGEPAQTDGAGYIINGYGSYTIKGYRTSNDEVHPFVFSNKRKSYANRSESGDIKDCGVIGVVFHWEKPKETYIPNTVPWKPDRYPWDVTPWSPWYGDTIRFSNGEFISALSSSNNLVACNSMRSSGFDLGTKFAEQSINDKVVDSSFKIGSIASQFEIYYASESALRSMGVPIDQSRQIAFPKAFKKGFCKPPR
jgi:hypothetical protein